MDTRLLYTLLVAAVALGRLIELRIAERHRRSLLARGGVEAGAGHYPWMVALHTAFLVSCPLEVWLLDRPFLPLLAAAMLALLLGAVALRWWVIATLGERWTTRILILPGKRLRSPAGPIASCATPTTWRWRPRSPPSLWCTPPGSRPWHSAC